MAICNSLLRLNCCFSQNMLFRMNNIYALVIISFTNIFWGSRGIIIYIGTGFLYDILLHILKMTLPQNCFVLWTLSVMNFHIVCTVFIFSFKCTYLSNIKKFFLSVPCLAKPAQFLQKLKISNLILWNMCLYKRKMFCQLKMVSVSERLSLEFCITKSDIYVE